MAASFTHHVGMSSPNWTTSASDALRAGAGFSLAALDPAATPGFTGGKAEGAAELEERGRFVGELQERLFAHSVAGTAAGSVKRRSRSEEHTSELPSLMRTSYAVFCLIKKTIDDTR